MAVTRASPPRADPADDCQARIDADPHLRSKPEAQLHCGQGVGQTLLDQQGRAAGAQRGVFERRGNAEQGHDAVAREVLHRAAQFAHSIHHDRVNGLDQLVRAPLFAQAFPDTGHITCHVGEQDRNLTAFAWRYIGLLVRTSPDGSGWRSFLRDPLEFQGSVNQPTLQLLAQSPTLLRREGMSAVGGKAGQRPPTGRYFG